MGRFTLVLLILVCFASAAIAQSQVRPSVSVVGEADMKISPDQVVFTFEVITTDKDVTVAKQANDARSSKTLAAAKAFNMAADDIQTETLTIAPKYTGEKDPRGADVLIGYLVTKRILITLKEVDKIDSFVAKVIEAGVNRVVDISIENSNLQKYQEEVRAMAVKNAQAKAESYAKRLGQTIGKAYVIREEEGDLPTFGMSGGIGSGNGDGVGPSLESDRLEEPTAYNRAITFALGKIKVEEKIYVTFELNR
ncbi:MAG: SIMPL domain-containing protein [Acidobacteriota bacterium]